MRRTILLGTLILAILSPAAYAVFQPAPPIDRDGRFGSGSDDFSGDIAFDALGNSYHMVSTDGTFPGETSVGSRDLVVRKNDPAGNEVWTTQFGTSGTDNYGMTMAVTPGGISAIVGNTTAAFPGFTFLGGFYDAFIAIFDTDGNQIAVDQFGTASWDDALGVYTDGTKFWVTGFTDGTFPGETSAGGRDGFVRVYGLDGTLLDSTQFGTSGSDNPSDVAVDGSGNVYVTGFTGGAFSPSIGLNDGFVVKLDPALDFVVGTNHGTTATDNYRAIDIGTGGHVIVTGATFGAIPGQTASGWDIVIERIDPVTTSSLWIRQFGLTSSYDSGQDVAVAADGTSYTAGNTYGIEGLGTVANTHGFVLALDAAGSDLWADQFIATGATLGIYGCGLDPAGQIWLAGYTKGAFGGAPAGAYDAIYRGYQPFAGSVTDITACGFVADAPGDYRLAGDVVGGGVCVDVTSPGVVLDLNGFRITAQDDGTDLPGVGVRVGAGLDTQIVNQGVSQAEIVVDGAGGVGVDLTGADGAVVDGGAQRIQIELTALGDTKSGVDLSGSTGATVQAVDGHNASPDGTAFLVDGAFGLAVRDGYWAHEESLAVQRDLYGSNLFDFETQDVTSEGGGIEVQGSGLDITRYQLTPGVSPQGGIVEIEGDGTVDDLFVDGGLDLFWGSAGFRGDPADPAGTLTLITPRFEGFQADVTFGDNVVVQDGAFVAGGPDGKIFIESTTFPATLIGARFRVTDPSHPLAIDVAPGASAIIDDNVTMETYTPDGQSLIGSVGLFGTDMPLSSGVRYDPFVAAHVAKVEDDLVSVADALYFFLAGLSNGDKTTFVNGVVEAGCVSEPDGWSVTCPPAPGTYKFGHEVNDVGCGAVYGTPDIVVLQEADLTAASGTTCIELATAVTYDMNDRRIRVPAGSPGGETRGVAITGAGATVQDGTIEMTGADTIGTDVTADGATLRTVAYEYDHFGSRGIRARNIENFTVIDDTHTASGPAGERIAYGYDGVRRVRVERSVADDPQYAYDFQWDIENSDGTITNANWTGGISASGAGVTATLVVEDSIWDSRRVSRTIDFGDDVVYRRGGLYVGDASPIGNRALNRGPRFEDTTFHTYDERGIPLIEDNPGAPSVFAESLRIRTERNGLIYGRTEFPPTVPDTNESGVTTRYAYDDRDTARLGDDLPAEPMVTLTFEQMETPSDPLGVAVYLVVAAQDAIASGGCVVSSVAPDPVELTCDRDLGTGVVQTETLHYVYCGDGIANAQVADDACDPPGSGKCQAGCTLPPPTDLIDHRIEVSDTNPDDLILTWNDSGEGPYEIYRSTDPANVEAIPENKIGLTSGTTWTDTPPAGQSYYYRVIPAP